jgi:hypothetical protein
MIPRRVLEHKQPGRTHSRPDRLIWKDDELVLLREGRVIGRIEQTSGGWWRGDVVGAMSSALALDLSAGSRGCRAQDARQSHHRGVGDVVLPCSRKTPI